MRADVLRAGAELLEMALLAYGPAKVTMDDFYQWSLGFSFVTFWFLIGAGISAYFFKWRIISPYATAPWAKTLFKWQMKPHLWSADHWRPLLLASAALFGTGALVIAWGAPAGVPVVLAGYFLLAWTLYSLSLRRSWARYGAAYLAALGQMPPFQLRGRRTTYVIVARVALVLAIIEVVTLLVLWALVNDVFWLFPVVLLLPVFQGTVAWIVLSYLKKSA